jgi:hypothetical protein
VTKAQGRVLGGGWRVVNVLQSDSLEIKAVRIMKMYTEDGKDKPEYLLPLNVQSGVR